MIDILLLLGLAGVTFLVAQERAWGAVITFLSTLIAGLVAMNFFEPLAEFLGRSVWTSQQGQHCWDVICLLGLFALAVSVLRVIGDKLMPTYAEVHPLLYEFARWGFGLLSGYVVVSIVLTALHVAPLPRTFLGFTPERNNFFGFAPDRQWLAFTQYVSEHSLQTRGLDGRLVIFDGPVFPRIPNTNKQEEEKTMQVWSSFPIRYAARRQQYSLGGAPSSTGGGSIAPPPPPPSSSPGKSGPGRGTNF